MASEINYSLLLMNCYLFYILNFVLYNDYKSKKNIAQSGVTKRSNFGTLLILLFIKEPL